MCPEWRQNLFTIPRKGRCGNRALPTKTAFDACQTWRRIYVWPESNLLSGIDRIIKGGTKQGVWPDDHAGSSHRTDPGCFCSWFMNNWHPKYYSDIGTPHAAKTTRSSGLRGIPGFRWIISALVQKRIIRTEALEGWEKGNGFSMN